MTVATLPDAEALVINALLASSDVAASTLKHRIYSVVPKRRVYPLARVVRYGGSPLWDGDPYWVDQASLQIDVWAQGGTVEARSLSELLRASCAALGGGHPEGVVTKASVSGLAQMVDLTFDPPKPRYRFTVTLLLHPWPGSPGPT